MIIIGKEQKWKYVKSKYAIPIEILFPSRTQMVRKNVIECSISV